jgi:hypothetical protein
MMVWILSAAALLGLVAIWWVCSISISQFNNQLILHKKTRTRCLHQQEQEKWTGMMTMTMISMSSLMTTHQLYQTMMHITPIPTRMMTKAALQRI